MNDKQITPADAAVASSTFKEEATSSEVTAKIDAFIRASGAKIAGPGALDAAVVSTAKSTCDSPRRPKPGQERRRL